MFTHKDIFVAATAPSSHSPTKDVAKQAGSFLHSTGSLSFVLGGKSCSPSQNNLILRNTRWFSRVFRSEVNEQDTNFIVEKLGVNKALSPPLF